MKSHYVIHLNGSARPLRAIAFDLDSTLTRPYLDFKKLRQQLNFPKVISSDGLSSCPRLKKCMRKRLSKPLSKMASRTSNGMITPKKPCRRSVTWGFHSRSSTRNSRASLLAVCHRLRIEVDVLVAREDAPPKPDPGCIHHTASQLGVATSHLLMIGDYRHDMDAGRAAGAMTVLLTNGQTPTWPVEADLVIERLDELLLYLR